MCGICGFISKREISLAQLKEMNDLMVHRGPDDSGAQIFPAAEGYSVGLAHRRLSILDLSSLGHQPMDSADGRLTIVYNGEIYNFKELRQQLTSYPFRSSCDTEVILAAYLQWGISCVEHFNGMFAFAIFDREEQALYLARDRIGKKPLYYWLQDGELVFASELKALMAYPFFQKEIDRRVLSRYLYIQYINAPQTIFSNTYKLEPGSILRFCGGTVACQKYWDVADVYQRMHHQPVTDYAQAKQELKELLGRAVAQRMVADVPVGSFLSGGYDSSLVTAIAQSQSSRPVKTYAIGFTEKRLDEAPYAKAVARHLGTDHTELYIGEAEMADLVESIPKYYDEPFADSSQIPSMLVSALARQSVTVVVTGDGGDEFFCGYNTYPSIKKVQYLYIPGRVTAAVCSLPGLRGSHLVETLPYRVRKVMSIHGKDAQTQVPNLYCLSWIDRIVAPWSEGESLPIFYPVEQRYHVKDWQIRRMLLDMDTYLPGDILCKVDRASMKYSLEVRCPILDKDVMEYSFRLPQQFKYKNGIKKRILKDIAYDYIPRDLLDRPKAGFSVPLGKWLRGPLKEQLVDMSGHDFLAAQGLFDPDGMAAALSVFFAADTGPSHQISELTPLLWSYFVFQQWYRTYMG